MAAVEEVSFRFVVVGVGAFAEDFPSRSPLDSRDCRAGSSPMAPYFGCSSPSGRRADSVEMAAYWPDCDEFVYSDASVHPCHRLLGNGRAYLSSCRNS